MSAHFKDLTLDARDHQALADWWCEALGYRRREPAIGQDARPSEWPVPLYDPEGHGPLLWVNPVEEPAPGPSRMRLDVYGYSSELQSLGARMVRKRGDKTPWDVLSDPEGNEFAVFEPRLTRFPPKGR